MLPEEGPARGTGEASGSEAVAATTNRITKII